MNKNEWEKVEIAPAWNGKQEDGSFPLVEGDEVSGVFIRVDSGVGANAANMYIIKTTDGVFANVWGGAILDTRLKNIEPGDEVKIVYMGDGKGKKGWTYHNYDVFHRKGGEQVEQTDDVLPAEGTE